MCAAAASRKSDMAPVSGGKGQVTQGVLSNSVGEWSFKEGNTKVVSLGAGKKSGPAASGRAQVKGGKKEAAKKGAAKAASRTAAVDSLVKEKKPAGKASKGKKSASAKPAATPDGGKYSKPKSSSQMTVAEYRKFLAGIQKTKRSK